MGGSQRHAAAVEAHLYPLATRHPVPSLQLEGGGGGQGGKRGEGEKRKTERRERKTKDVTVANKL